MRSFEFCKGEPTVEPYANHGPIAEDLDELGPIEGFDRVRVEIENPDSTNRH